MVEVESGVKSVVVTFKCSPRFKEWIDEYSKSFDSRSAMIRGSIYLSMRGEGFKID